MTWNLGGGRTLPPLVFVTNSALLGARIGAAMKMVIASDITSAMRRPEHWSRTRAMLATRVAAVVTP